MRPMEKYAPGTVMPYSEIGEGMFSLFKPMIKAADGLSLGQVSALTGLEYSTIQNWVKRGFVAHPVNKKYYERQLARILVISALRDCMKIDDIVRLLASVNGSVEDDRDDIVSESTLYDHLCEAAKIIDESQVLDVDAIAEQVIGDYVGPAEDSRKRLLHCFTVMIYALVSGRYKREADLLLARLDY